jgi:hypothetical protein
VRTNKKRLHTSKSIIALCRCQSKSD